MIEELSRVCHGRLIQCRPGAGDAPQTCKRLACRVHSARDIDPCGGTSSDLELQALLTVVREQMTDLGNVSDGSGQAALDAGWMDAQLAETTVYVSLNVLTNYFNHVVQTELDLPAAPTL